MVYCVTNWRHCSSIKRRWHSIWFNHRTKHVQLFWLSGWSAIALTSVTAWRRCHDARIVAAMAMIAFGLSLSNLGVRPQALGTPPSAPAPGKGPAGGPPSAGLPGPPRVREQERVRAQRVEHGERLVLLRGRRGHRPRQPAPGLARSRCWKIQIACRW